VSGAGRTLPSAPVLERLGDTDDETSARQLGVSSRTIVRWRGGQRMRITTADRAAVALGYHPAQLWPEWWDLA
jgi:hypothetical protein